MCESQIIAQVFSSKPLRIETISDDDDDPSIEQTRRFYTQVLCSYTIATRGTNKGGCSENG